MLKNFLWGGTNNTFKIMVRWSYYCAKKAIEGLGLTNPNEAIETFIGNLKQLHGYKLERSKSFQHKTWTPNFNWA